MQGDSNETEDCAESIYDICSKVLWELVSSTDDAVVAESAESSAQGDCSSHASSLTISMDVATVGAVDGPTDSAPVSHEIKVADDPKTLLIPNSNCRRSLVADLLGDEVAAEVDMQKIDVAANISKRRSSISKAQNAIASSNVVSRPRRSAAVTAAVKNAVVLEKQKKKRRRTPVFEVLYGEVATDLQPCMRKSGLSTTQKLAKRISEKYRKRSSMSTPSARGICFNEKCAIKVITPMPGWKEGTVRMPESDDEEEVEDTAADKKRVPRLSSVNLQITPESLNRLATARVKQKQGERCSLEFNARMVFGDDEEWTEADGTVPATGGKKRRKSAAPPVMPPRLVLDDSFNDVISSATPSTSEETIRSGEEKSMEKPKTTGNAQSRRRSTRLSIFFDRRPEPAAPAAVSDDQTDNVISQQLTETVKPSTTRKSRRSTLFVASVASASDSKEAVNGAPKPKTVGQNRRKSRKSGLFVLPSSGEKELTAAEDLPNVSMPPADTFVNTVTVSANRLETTVTMSSGCGNELTTDTEAIINSGCMSQTDLSHSLPKPATSSRTGRRSGIPPRMMSLMNETDMTSSARGDKMTSLSIGVEVATKEPDVTVEKSQRAPKLKSGRRSNFLRKPTSESEEIIPIVDSADSTGLENASTMVLPPSTATSSEGDGKLSSLKSRRRTTLKVTSSSRDEAKKFENKGSKPADREEKKNGPDHLLIIPETVGDSSSTKRNSVLSWLKGVSVEETEKDTSLEAEKAVVDSLLKTRESLQCTIPDTTDSDSNMVEISSSESTVSVNNKENVSARARKAKKVTEKKESGMHNFLKPSTVSSRSTDTVSSESRRSKRKSTVPPTAPKRKPIVDQSVDEDDDVIEVIEPSSSTKEKRTASSTSAKSSTSTSSVEKSSEKDRKKKTKENKLKGAYLAEVDHAPFPLHHSHPSISLTGEEEVKHWPAPRMIRSEVTSTATIDWTRPLPPRKDASGPPDIRQVPRLPRDQVKQIVNELPGEELAWYEYARECRAANKEAVWVDALRPRDTTKWLGGGDAARRARSFVYQWKKRVTKEAAAIAEPKKNKSRRHEDDDSDYDGEEEMEPQLDNPLILCGPTGCGKSALIAALCDEFGMKALEVHPGERRNGAALRAKLAGAGQSHRVQTSGGIASFFSAKPADSKAKTDVSPKTQTLIVVEHVDVHFSDDDKEFFSTLKSLAVEARVPVIWTCNVFPRVELEREPALVSYQLIDIERMSVRRMADYVRMVALAFARVLLSIDDLIDWVNSCRGDLRATLLDLQMALASKQDACLHVPAGHRATTSTRQDLNHVARSVPVDIQQQREQRREDYEDVVLVVEGERDVIPSLRAVAELARDSLNNGCQIRDITVDYLPILAHIDTAERQRAQGQRRYLHYFSEVHNDVQIDSTGQLRAALPRFRMPRPSSGMNQ